MSIIFKQRDLSARVTESMRIVMYQLSFLQIIFFKEEEKEEEEEEEKHSKKKKNNKQNQSFSSSNSTAALELDQGHQSKKHDAEWRLGLSQV